MAGGAPGGSPAQVDTIDYITIAQTGNAVDFGNLTEGISHSLGGMSNGTRGVLSYSGYQDPSRNQAEIDFITIPTTGNAQDFGDCEVTRHTNSSCSNSIRGISGGGLDPSATARMDYITIATRGNTTDFGNLSSARRATTACASSLRGVWGGGGPSLVDTIEYVTIATEGNAVDFGNLNTNRENGAACSNEHGGVG